MGNNVIPVGLCNHYIDIDAIIAQAKGDSGLSAYELAVQAGYTGTLSLWLESLKGKDAYQLAVLNGFSGSLEDWLKSLQSDVVSFATDSKAHTAFDLDNNVKFYPLILSNLQKDIARTNIDAANKEDVVESIELDYYRKAAIDSNIGNEVTYSAQVRSEQEKTIARNNIGAASASVVEALLLQIVYLLNKINELLETIE